MFFKKGVFLYYDPLNQFFLVETPPQFIHIISSHTPHFFVLEKDRTPRPPVIGPPWPAGPQFDGGLEPRPVLVTTT